MMQVHPSNCWCRDTWHLFFVFFCANYPTYMWLTRSWNSQWLMWTRTPGPTALHPLRRMQLENASSFAGVELSRLQELSCRQQGNYTLTRDRTGVLRVWAQESTNWTTWGWAWFIWVSLLLQASSILFLYFCKGHPILFLYFCKSHPILFLYFCKSHPYTF